MNGYIFKVSFSPTHTTQTISTILADTLSEKTGKDITDINLTLSDYSAEEYEFGPTDILLLGFPVYGGRIPALVKKRLPKLHARNTTAILSATYGNRDYDDALLEAKDLLTEQGFTVIAAAAFIGEHSFSQKLAANRPDPHDRSIARQYAEQIADKILSNQLQEITVKGKKPYTNHFAGFPFLPKTNANCSDCFICVQNCPARIIDTVNPRIVTSGCIQCFSCIKSCPVRAKYFDDEQLLQITEYLENNFMDRKEPELFI
jgi:Ferredoxin